MKIVTFVKKGTVPDGYKKNKNEKLNPSSQTWLKRNGKYFQRETLRISKAFDKCL